MHFAIRAIDDAGNVAPVSNDAPARTPDVAPAAIDDLAQTAVGLNSLSLGWTAVGDDEYIGAYYSTKNKPIIAKMELEFR